MDHHSHLYAIQVIDIELFACVSFQEMKATRTIHQFMIFFCDYVPTKMINIDHGFIIIEIICVESEELSTSRSMCFIKVVA